MNRARHQPTDASTRRRAGASRALAVLALLAGLLIGAVGGTLLTASTASADAADARRHAAGQTKPTDLGAAAPAPQAKEPRDEATDAADAELAATLERLAFINDVLTQRIAERSTLGERIEAANEQDREDLRRNADALTSEINELRSTLESIATGGVDTRLFDEPEETEEERDWREDIALIAEPIIASLKEITEKPRRIKELNEIIDLRQSELAVANEAISGLTPELEAVEDDSLGRLLEQLDSRWQKRADDAQAAIDIAHFQIANLRGDQPVWRKVFIAMRDFATGRGLTLLMIVVAATGVLYATRFLLRGYRRTLLDRTEPESRTRYRLAEYSMHALTGLMMLVAVFVVIYQRGDVLLLGLMILLFVGLALGVRHLLPRYISEARLLLNIGPMREGERLIYNDLPWQVESINMFTILRNPELNGVLRIPLSTLNGIPSRPAGSDPWFPTSCGDVVLVDNDPEQLAEVIDQNPDTVTLRERGGQTRVLPSSTFYRSAMTNLTRNGSFGLERRFRVDYELQSTAVSEVPRILTQAIHEALANTDTAAFMQDVAVELESAGDSSLLYWCYVSMDSRAALSYRRIERLIQSACISACTSQGWSIPFPHLSVVPKGDALIAAEHDQAA